MSYRSLFTQSILLASCITFWSCREQAPQEAAKADETPTFKAAVPELPELTWNVTRAYNLPLNNPAHVPAVRAQFMEDQDTVLGVILGDEARAYPWTLMANYHAANDILDNQPIIVNLCEACNGGAAFLATIPGTIIDIRPRGLKNGTWYGTDFQTGSLWYPFIGEAFEGPLKGTKLVRIRAYFSSWEDWKKEHPETSVAVSTHEMRMRPHGRASMMAADSTFNPQFLKKITDPKPNPMRALMPGQTLVFGMIPQKGDAPLALTLNSLRRAKSPFQSTFENSPVLIMLQNEYEVGAYKRELNGVELTLNTISKDPLIMVDQRGNHWNIWGKTISGKDHPSKLELLDGYIAKWYEWIENFPKTKVIDPK